MYRSLVLDDASLDVLSGIWARMLFYDVHALDNQSILTWHQAQHATTLAPIFARYHDNVVVLPDGSLKS